MTTRTPEELAAGYSYRQLKDALWQMNGGPIGFDLFRDDRTRSKLGLAKFILDTFGDAKVTGYCPPVEQPIEMGAGYGNAAAGGGGGAADAQDKQAQAGAAADGDGQGAAQKGEAQAQAGREGKGEAQGAGQGQQQGQGKGQGKAAGKGQGKGGDKAGQQGQQQGGDGQQQQGQQGGQTDEHPLVKAVRQVVGEELPKLVQPALDAVGEAAMKVADAVQAQQTPAVNEAAVRAIVEEAVAKVKPAAPKEIVIKAPGQPPVKIAGHVNPAFEEALAALTAGLNVALVGPAGTGKTHMGHMLSTAMNVPYGSISYTAGASESWLLGRNVPNLTTGKNEYVTSRFCELYVQRSLHLHDEYDGADSNMQLSLNAALANGGFYNPVSGQFLTRHPEAMQIAAVNTFGTGPDALYVGRNQMDEAARDRWYFIPVDYDRTFEAALAPDFVCEWVWRIRDGITKHRLRRVMSTRAIQKAAGMLSVGRKWPEIQERLLGNWTRDERAKVNA